MTYWTQRRAVLSLTAEGADVFHLDASEAVLEVLVEWADELGLWIFYEQIGAETRTVRLLKWAYLSSATMDLVVEQPERKDAIGFMPYLVKDPKSP